VFLGVETALVENYAVDEMWIKALKLAIASYAACNVHQILNHLHNNVIALDNHGHTKMKKFLETEWDGTTNLEDYFYEINKGKAQCDKWGVNIYDGDIIMATIQQMYSNGEFEKRKSSIGNVNPLQTKHGQTSRCISVTSTTSKNNSLMPSQNMQATTVQTTSPNFRQQPTCHQWLPRTNCRCYLHIGAHKISSESMERLAALLKELTATMKQQHEAIKALVA
jgi:hypothetical protein